jgi:hypothetical protein
MSLLFFAIDWVDRGSIVAHVNDSVMTKGMKQLFVSDWTTLWDSSNVLLLWRKLHIPFRHHMWNEVVLDQFPTYSYFQWTSSSEKSPLPSRSITEITPFKGVDQRNRTTRPKGVDVCEDSSSWARVSMPWSCPWVRWSKASDFSSPTLCWFEEKGDLTSLQQGQTESVFITIHTSKLIDVENACRWCIRVRSFNMAARVESLRKFDQFISRLDDGTTSSELYQDPSWYLYQIALLETEKAKAELESQPSHWSTRVLCRSRDRMPIEFLPCSQAS